MVLQAREHVGDRRRAVLDRPLGALLPPLPARLVASLHILEHRHDLSDEAPCARRLENPCFQEFCCDVTFCHERRFDRSSLTRWRQRLSESELAALVQENLSVAHKTGALRPATVHRARGAAPWDGAVARCTAGENPGAE